MIFLPIIITILIFAVVISNSLKGSVIFYIIMVGISSIYFNPAHSDELITIAGSKIYFFDIITIVFYFALSYRLLSRKNEDPLYRPFLIYFILQHIYVIVSVMYYGKSAFIFAKSSLYFIVPLFYFLTFEIDAEFLKKIFSYYYGYIIFIILLAVARLAGIIPLPAYYQDLLSQGTNEVYTELRVLNAYQALDLVVFVLVLLFLIQNKIVRLFPHIFLIILSLALVLIVQQRTVWTIAAVLFITYFLANVKNIKVVVYGALLGVLGLIFIQFIMKSSFLNDVYSQSFLGVLNNPQGSTGAIRYFQASYLFGRLISNSSLITGELYGASTMANIGNMWTDFGIHMYHFSILYFGGLILFIPYAFFQLSVLLASFKIKLLEKMNWLFFLIVLGNIIFNFTTSPSPILPLYYFLIIYLYKHSEEVVEETSPVEELAVQI